MTYLDSSNLHAFNANAVVPCTEYLHSNALVLRQMFFIEFPFKNIISVLGTVTLFSQTVHDSPCIDFYLFT